MAKTIIEAIHESLDPTTVSNAIYETMLDWYSLTSRIQAGEPRKTRMKDRRSANEVLLARMLGMEHTEVRRLLALHFGVEA